MRQKAKITWKNSLGETVCPLLLERIKETKIDCNYVSIRNVKRYKAKANKVIVYLIRQFLKNRYFGMTVCAFSWFIGVETNTRESICRLHMHMGTLNFENVSCIEEQFYSINPCGQVPDQSFNSSVIRQKVESQNGCHKKTARHIFRKTNISYLVIARARVRIWD